jgi:hypothetical protein
LWLAVFGGCLAYIVYILKPMPVDLASNTWNTLICFKSGIDPFAAVSSIIPLINDTLVFLAISWRLSRNAYPLESGIGVRVFIFGEYLPLFSKVLLRDGQAYYLSALS